MFLTLCPNLLHFWMSSHVPPEMSHMVSLVYYEIWDFHIFFIWYCILFKYIMFNSRCLKFSTHFFLFCLIFLVSTTWQSLSCQVSHIFFFLYQFLNDIIIKTLNVCHVIPFFLLHNMNYMFGNNIEYLWQTSKNHLVHNACVYIQHVCKK